MDGVQVKPTENWRWMGSYGESDTFIIRLHVGAQVLAIESQASQDRVSVYASADNGLITDESWMVSKEGHRVSAVGLCDNNTIWSAATALDNGADWIRVKSFPHSRGHGPAKRIWTKNFLGDTKDSRVYFRKVLGITDCLLL